MMPEIDGIETLRRIRRGYKNLPVLMLTAYGDEEKMGEARELGISGFIHKGKEFSNASEAIRIVLRGIKKE
ncbi:MAG: response regulator [Candidatus Omnitrophota bacterium]